MSGSAGATTVVVVVAGAVVVVVVANTVVAVVIAGAAVFEELELHAVTPRHRIATLMIDAARERLGNRVRVVVVARPIIWPAYRC